jgi:hypothetical protein
MFITNVVLVVNINADWTDMHQFASWAVLLYNLYAADEIYFKWIIIIRFRYITK